MANRLRQAIRTFHKAAGIKGELIFIIVTPLVERAVWFYQKLIDIGTIQNGAGKLIFGLPSWMLAFVFALGLIAFWMFRYAHKLRMQIQVARVELSILREKGVGIRNRGRREITDVMSWISWKEETEEWHRAVYEALKKISVADAEWFNTMDVVPDPRLCLKKKIDDPKFTKPQFDRYSQHDFQVKRLGEMIRDLWGK